MNPVSRLYVASAVVSICGITFEVLLGALGSYTLGDSVKQYAFTIGLFLSGMGVGSALSEKVMRNLLERFVQIEYLIGLTGGFSSFLLFFILAYTGDYTLGQVFLYAITFLIGGLTGLELPLLIRKASEIGERLNRSTARVLFSDYAGSLIGAVAFVILLRPYLGLTKTAFLIGLINTVVAVWMLYSFRKEFLRFPFYFALGIVLSLILLTGFVFGDRYVAGMENRLYEDPVVRAFDTKYQRVVVTKAGDDIRLFLNGNIQFSSSDEYRYHEPLVHIPMALASSHDRVLVLGGGDGIVIRELLKYNDLGQVTLVDLDRELVTFAKSDPLLRSVNKGALESPKLSVVYQDAFQFLLKNDGMYDVIIVDLPDPNNESLNKLYTVTFYKMMKAHLHPDGVASVQSTSPLFATKAYWTINRTLEAAGFVTGNYHVDVPSFGNWGFTLAARQPFSLDDIRIQVDTRFLTSDLVPALFAFGKDEDDVLYEKGKRFEWRPNTMNRPILMEYYYNAWRYY